MPWKAISATTRAGRGLVGVEQVADVGDVLGVHRQGLGRGDVAQGDAGGGGRLNSSIG